MLLVCLMLVTLVQSEPFCRSDESCAYFPDETKQCKDLWSNCRNSALLCLIVPREKCARSCGFCPTLTNCTCTAEWSTWSRCNKLCDGGEMYRTRDCNITKECRLATRQAKKCNTQSRKVWSPCTRECGGGSQWRLATCEPSKTSSPSKEYRDCHLQRCPSRGCPRDDVPRYNDWSSCCLPSRSPCGIFTVGDNDIIGGVNARPMEFPWMLLLEIDLGRKYFCGAVLISERWAVTAAHCVQYFGKGKLTIKGGVQNIYDRSEGSEVEVVTIHPLFDMPTADIAVIKFQPLANLRFPITPICLTRGEVTPIDADCYAAGWGSTVAEARYHKVSSDLKVVKLRNLDLESCKIAYRNTTFGKSIDHSMLCAGTHAGGRDTCAGDSGGPLMCQRCSTCSWYLAGITSFGASPCAAPGFPGVYSKIVEHELWIDHVSNRTAAEQQRKFKSC